MKCETELNSQKGSKKKAKIQFVVWNIDSTISAAVSLETRSKLIFCPKNFSNLINLTFLWDVRSWGKWHKIYSPDRPGSAWPPVCCKILLAANVWCADDDDDIVVVGNAGGNGSGSVMSNGKTGSQHSRSGNSLHRWCCMKRSQQMSHPIP